MKKLLTIVVLGLLWCNISLSEEKITIFQIENISLFDSALKHFSKEKLINTKMAYYQHIKKNKNMFSTSEIGGSYDLYDTIQISYKTNDPDYKIYFLSGLLSFKSNINQCYEKKKEIEKDLETLFSNLRSSETSKKTHRADPTGKSFSTSKVFIFPNNEYYVGVRCIDWSPQTKKTDHLRVVIKSKEFNNWLAEK